MNGIRFNKLWLKNFLSFGNNMTELDLSGDFITVVLGVNHDTGGDESRNGVGKSAITDAISYCLFGQSIRGISNANLVNKLARKGQQMLTIIEFDTPEGSFRIERGENPAHTKLFQRPPGDDRPILTRDNNEYIFDRTRSRPETTKEIERVLGFDFKMSEYLLFNSSESIPFMKLPEDKRRDIAERMMRLNYLSERAEELKGCRKDRKKELATEEATVTATERANNLVQEQITDLERRSRAWEADRSNRLSSLRGEIERVQGIDLDEQAKLLDILDEIAIDEDRIEGQKKDALSALRDATRDLQEVQREIEQGAKRFKELGEQKAKLDNSTCPTCNQHWIADQSVMDRIQTEIDDLGDFSVEAVDLSEAAEQRIADLNQQIALLEADRDELMVSIKEIDEIGLAFEDMESLKVAQALLERGLADIQRVEAERNPHHETIQGLKQQAIQEVSRDGIRELRKLIQHYDYLIELLQSKDSFLRKAVIDRWLPLLNSRIAHYLSVLDLPFDVRIENDLQMTITDFGEEFTWGNLSRGQRQRVTIALNLSFQDLFEATDRSFNLLVIDELIDTGICQRGATMTLNSLKEVCDAKSKRVFLITHRADIADQVDDRMTVSLRNRISRIERVGVEDDEGEQDEMVP